MSRPDPAGLLGPLALLLQELRGLLRVELALAKAEVTRGARSMAVGVSLVVMAAMLGFIGLVTLAAAAVIALNGQGFSWLHSALMVGGGALALAVVLILIGARRINPENLVPRRAMANLRADILSAAEAPHVQR